MTGQLLARLWLWVVRWVAQYDPVIDLDNDEFGRCKHCKVPLNKHGDCWWCA